MVLAPCMVPMTVAFPCSSPRVGADELSADDLQGWVHLRVLEIFAPARYGKLWLIRLGRPKGHLSFRDRYTTSGISWVAGCLLTALIDCASRDIVALRRLNAPNPHILVKGVDVIAATDQE
jgi:hypothetical protein